MDKLHSIKLYYVKKYIITFIFCGMKKLAIAYKMTGDNEQFEKYRKLYAINGGDVKQLDAYLASI